VSSFSWAKLQPSGGMKTSSLPATRACVSGVATQFSSTSSHLGFAFFFLGSAGGGGASSAAVVGSGVDEPHPRSAKLGTPSAKHVIAQATEARMDMSLLGFQESETLASSRTAPRKGSLLLPTTVAWAPPDRSQTGSTPSPAEVHRGRRRRAARALPRLRGGARPRALSGPRRGDPRDRRRAPRGHGDADRLGQVARRHGTRVPYAREWWESVLHLPHQGAGEREVLRALRRLRPGERRHDDRRRDHQLRRADHLLHRGDRREHGPAARRRRRRSTAS
jgi:hypothetical protein